MIDLTNKKMLSVLMMAIWLIQLLVELVAFGIVWQLNMLPGKYMLILAVLLGALWLLTGGLLYDWNELPYVDLDREYWNQSINENLNLYGKQY